eukprot:TRINITY_DN49395_c0_g1_i1.p1 TRINITY_DN49395_c0_g1~~TRINITY_DN49395_c0_g1_i1.p1  ORF type:complete len:269 (-),score=23.27 TRINITY_DN49395_c0_g1_i1:126-932(-)
MAFSRTLLLTVMSWQVSSQGFMDLVVANSMDISLTYLNSTQGSQLLKKSSHDRPYWQLMNHFLTETHSVTCGPTTATMVLNALGSQGLPAPVSNLYSFHFDNFSMVQHYWDLDNINASECAQKATSGSKGLSLSQVGAMLECASPRVFVDVVHCHSSSVSKFRESVVKAFEAEPLQFIAVNFDRHGLDQEGAGHHSPLGAYDAVSDRVLVLDVARYKYPPVWVHVEDLFRAMSVNFSHPEIPVKGFSTPRGFLVVSASETDRVPVFHT